MRPEYIRLVGLQCAIMIIGALFTYFVVTPQAARSVAYGSCVALVSALLLSWRLRRGERHVNLGAEWCLRQAYRTAIERFVLVVFLLAAGFGLLRLAPLWALAGFVAGQAAWLATPVLMKFENTK